MINYPVIVYIHGGKYWPVALAECAPDQPWSGPTPMANDKPEPKSESRLTNCHNNHHPKPDPEGEFRHGSKDHYSPEYLLDHGLILVTINYRLGVLGECCSSFILSQVPLG